MNSLLEFLNENYTVSAFGFSLLHSVWQGAGIALLLGLFLKISVQASAKTRYTLALLASGTLVACFAVTFSYYLTTAVPVPAQHSADAFLLLAPEREVGTIVEQSLVMQLKVQWSQLMLWLQEHVGYFLLAWFAGFLFYTSRFATGLFYLRSVKQQSSLLPINWADRVKTLQQKLGLTTNVSLVSSDKVSSPFTFGWLKPVIVVPAGMLTQLPADQVESILLHELAHIRRHDYLINLLQNIAELFFFFNPGYWYIAHVLEAEREHVCDDLVVQHTGNYHTYALALTNLAQLPVLGHNRLVMAAAARESSLMLRIKRIIHTSTSTTMTHNTSRGKSYQVTTLIIAWFLFAFLAIDVNGKNVKPGTAENAPVAVAIPEQLNVTGIVLSKDGKALPGVSIVIKNSKNGTVTSSDGKYTLSAKPTDTLAYRFIGFEKKQLAATDKETQRVVLEQSSKELSSGKSYESKVVIVEGKPVVHVQRAPMSEEKPEANISSINVKSATGEAKKQPAIFIYEHDALKGLESGTAAFAQAAAKGKRITEVQDIDPATIQAIHVLKDKHAVSTFGDAGINGAVLISLKENAFKAKETKDEEAFNVYPVPSDRFVKIKFFLDKKQHVKADAIDFNGVNVKTLMNQVLEKGWHEYEWDASKNPAGTYIIVLNKESGVENKRVVLK